MRVLLTRADRDVPDVPDVRDVLAADQRARAALRRAQSWARASARAVRGRSYRCAMQTDFDFYVGVWDVQNRRLVKRLAGSDEWETFPARSVARAVFDGAANLDEISFPTKGWSGLTLRLYDSDSDEWALYWVSDAASRIEPPVVGRWNDRREFVGYCDDTFEGRPVLVRFIWSGISEATAHWEQAFSIDAGQTWETNWVMDSTRVS